jgi:hypothetical protein
VRADNTYILASRYGSDTRDIISALCAAVPAAVNQVKPYIENILQKNSSARLQLQLHKYIWSSEQRGV